MKRKFIITFSMLTSIIGMNSYNAVCNNEGFNISAQDVQVNFYGVEAYGEQKDDEVYLSIQNVPENMYAIVINNTQNTKETIKNFENGMAEIMTPNASNIYNYTIKIYSSTSECENELLRTINKNSLAYNNWYISNECVELRKNTYVDEEETDKIQKEEFDGCKMFTDKIYTEKNFFKELEEYQNRQPEAIGNKILELFYKYYYFALIPIAVLGIYYIIRLALIKRRKKKNEE